MCMNCQSDMKVMPNPQGLEEEAFAGKMLGMINAGAATIMISIGHRLGIFDAMAGMGESTSQEIADTAKLNERYVREWLNAMVTSQIIMYDQKTKTYYLPTSHAKFLTRANPTDNMAGMVQYLPMFAANEDKMMECFKHGGGLPYSEFPRFQEVMAEDSGQSLSMLMKETLPMVPEMMERLESGIDVLEVGFGRGMALMTMAKHFPNSRFTGYEISDEGIKWAREQAAKANLNNVQFVKQDAATFDEPHTYDLILTFDSVHDQAQPDRLLENIYRALRPNGVYLMQDIDMRSDVGDNMNHPIGTLIYTISCMHCMTVSLAMNGAGLGAAWGIEMAQSMLKQAGFDRIQVNRMEHDFQNCYYIMKKEM